MTRGLVLVLLAGCLDPFAPEVGAPNRPDPDACDADGDPATAVSFEDDIQPLLDEHCTRCHRRGEEGVEQSGLDLTSYDALIAGGQRSVDTIAIAGAPCDSVLVQKLGPAPPFGDRMPRGESPLAADEVALIHDWIAEGARP